MREYNETPLTVQNLVFTCLLNMPLNLRHIVQHMGGRAGYNPRRFAAVVSRSLKPRIALLLFGSGKMVCTGAKKSDQARFVINKNVEELIEMGYKGLKICMFKIENMVCSAVLPMRINRESLAKSFPIECTLDHEQFPGVIWRHEQIKPITLLVFNTGKIVLTGALSQNGANAAFRKVLPILRKHSISKSIPSQIDSASYQGNDGKENVDDDDDDDGGDDVDGMDTYTKTAFFLDKEDKEDEEKRLTPPPIEKQSSSQKIRNINRIASTLESEKHLKKLEQEKGKEKKSNNNNAMKELNKVMEEVSLKEGKGLAPATSTNAEKERGDIQWKHMPIINESLSNNKPSIKIEAPRSRDEKGGGGPGICCDHCKNACEKLSEEAVDYRLFGGFCCLCEGSEGLKSTRTEESCRSCIDREQRHKRVKIQ